MLEVSFIGMKPNHVCITDGMLEIGFVVSCLYHGQNVRSWFYSTKPTHVCIENGMLENTTKPNHIHAANKILKVDFVDQT